MKLQNDLKYWQDKCIDSKIENQSLTFEIEQLQSNKKKTDDTTVAELKKTIQDLEQKQEVY